MTEKPERFAAFDIVRFSHDAVFFNGNYLLDNDQYSEIADALAEIRSHYIYSSKRCDQVVFGQMFRYCCHQYLMHNCEESKNRKPDPDLYRHQKSSFSLWTWESKASLNGVTTKQVSASSMMIMKV